MTWFDVYLFTRLDALNALFIASAIIVLCAGTFLTVVGAMQWRFNESELGEKLARKTWKWAVPICFFFGLLSTITPTTKEFAAIYLIPKVVNNEHAKQIPDNALKLLNAKFEEWIKETTEKK